MTTLRAFSKLFILGGLLWLPYSAFAWNAQIDTQVVQTQTSTVLIPMSSPVQSDFSRVLAQGIFTDQGLLVDNLLYTVTLWGSWDTLPSNNPSQLTNDKGQASSRLLQGYATWSPLPGLLQFQAGKILVTPSVGLFRTPLNFFLHPALAPVLDGAALGPWQEGYWGENTQILWDHGSLSLWLSPKLTWSDSANQFWQYLSLPQNFWRSELNLSWQSGNTTFQILGESDLPDAGWNDPTAVLHGGGSIDAALNDAWTIKAEGRVDVSPHSAPQTQGLAGLAWSPAERLSVTVEVATDPSGLHGFFRWSLPVDDKVDAVLYAIPSLEDASGIAGGELQGRYDAWGWTAWVELPWGEVGTEQGNTSWRGTYGVKGTLYF